MNRIFPLFILLQILLFCCGDKDPEPTGKSETYQIISYNNSTISATAKLSELSNGFTDITLTLDGTSESENYLAHIHAGNVNNFGEIIAHLGNSNIQNSEISALLNNRTYAYEEWINFNGYIAIHVDDDDVYPIVALGNIGSNTQ